MVLKNKSIKIIKSLSLTLFPFLVILRDSWNGKYFGDPYDSRLEWVLYEHWYRFFLGERNLTDTLFFYPYTKSLGLSDAYLINGIIHSVYRILGFEPIESWKITNQTLILISIVLMMYLSRLLFRKYIYQFGFVYLSMSSSVLLNNISGQPNVVIYYLATGIILAIIMLSQDQITSAQKYVSVFVCLSLPPLLLLSNWYIGFFVHLLLFILIFINILINKRVAQLFIARIFVNVLKVSKIFTFLALMLSFGLYFLFLYIYLPNSNFNSLYWREIGKKWVPNLEGNYDSVRIELNSITSHFGYNYGDEPVFIGIGFVGFFTIFVVLMYLAISKKFRNDILSSFNLSLLITSILGFVFVISLRETSILVYISEYIEPLRTLKFSARIFIILVPVWIYLFIHLLEFLEIDSKRKTGRILLNIFIILILALIQFRSPISVWEKNDYAPNEFSQIIDPVKQNCDVIVVDEVGTGWWDDQIQGINLMALTGIPTANGYSGAYPNGYEVGDWNLDSQLKFVGQWLYANAVTDKVCVLYKSGFRFLTFPVGVSVSNNFDITESSARGSNWSWALSSNTSIVLQNYSDKNQKGVVKFQARLADCTAGTTILSVYDDKLIKLINTRIDSKLRNIEFQVSISAHSESVYNVSIESEGCLIDGGSRKVYFMLKDQKFSLNPAIDPSMPITGSAI